MMRITGDTSQVTIKYVYNISALSSLSLAWLERLTVECSR